MPHLRGSIWSVGLVLLLACTACEGEPAAPVDGAAPMPDAGPGTTPRDAGRASDGGTPTHECGDPIRPIPSGGLTCEVEAPTGLRPYLQAPTESSIWVNWITAPGASSESTVSYGTSPDALDHSATGDTVALSDASGAHDWHRVQLTGLTPDTTYHYRVRSGGEESAIFRFRTPRPAGTRGSGHLRFLILGDHQMRNDRRHERLVRAAYEKTQELFGCDVEDGVRVVINSGDQVDVGTLDHWANIHFSESALISPYVPIMTVVGNHETYQDEGLRNYRAHFEYDGLSYAGMPAEAPQDRELWYAFQLESALFLMLDTEHPNDAQARWVSDVVDAAAADDGVEWIFAVFHRPISAEMYPTDISTYVRDRIVPILARTPKTAMIVAGHHHLYSRGQIEGAPMYHIVSGGTAWDQYWGMAAQQDVAEIQKTIDHWAYQVVDIDLERREMTVETYAIGGPRIGYSLDNVLIDRFHRRFGQEAPRTPTILEPPTGPVALPRTFRSSAFSSDECELANTTQWQVSSSPDFAVVELDVLRDVENLYGTTGAPDYALVDVHAGVDLFALTVQTTDVANGTHYVRVRHRDANLEWSGWSTPVAFDVTNGTGGLPRLSTGSSVYAPSDAVDVSYANGRGGPLDWVGLYRYRGDAEAWEIPGGSGIVSSGWVYTTGRSGTASLTPVSPATAYTPGVYFAGLFVDDGYTEIADRALLYIGSQPQLAFDSGTHDSPFDAVVHPSGASVAVRWSSAQALIRDHLAVYRVGAEPGASSPPVATFAVGAASGTTTFEGLADGYYYLTYLAHERSYFEPGERVAFTVGTVNATLVASATTYRSGESIELSFSGGPGRTKDYIGIFVAGDTPGADPPAFRYVGGTTEGSVTFAEPLPPGEYFAALFVNDSYVEVSNRVALTVTP